MEHRLKTWPVFFKRVKSGEKKFEIRKNDRNFQVGDVLILQEWDQELKIYTGDKRDFVVTYVMCGPLFGLEAGYCIMSIDLIIWNGS